MDLFVLLHLTTGFFYACYSRKICKNIEIETFEMFIITEQATNGAGTNVHRKLWYNTDRECHLFKSCWTVGMKSIYLHR